MRKPKIGGKSTFPFELVVVEVIDHLKLKIVINCQNAEVDAHGWHDFSITIEQVLFYRKKAVSIDDPEDKSC